MDANYRVEKLASGRPSAGSITKIFVLAASAALQRRNLSMPARERVPDA